MSEKLVITLEAHPRGFYLTVEVEHPGAKYLQRTPYGPMTGAEALSLIADLPVRFVVTHQQERLF